VASPADTASAPASQRRPEPEAPQRWCQYWCQLAIENGRNRSKLVEASQRDKSSTIKESRVNPAFPHRP
jgi:hypothetical protein